MYMPVEAWFSKGEDNKLIEEANYCKKNKYFGYKFEPPLSQTI